MRRKLTFVQASLIALAAFAAQACFEESYSPPAYYGGGPAYYSSQPEYVPYYAGRPVVKNYYSGNNAQAHNDNWFHRDYNGTLHNSEGETPRQERHEQRH